jgi:hypothetical protein
MATGVYTGGPDDLHVHATKVDDVAAVHKGQVGRIAGVGQDFASAVSSPGAGTAIQTAINDVCQKGHQLHTTLTEIAGALRGTAGKTGSADQDNQAQIQKALNLTF